MDLSYKSFCRSFCMCCGAAVVMIVLLMSSGCGNHAQKHAQKLENSLNSGSSGNWEDCEKQALDVLKDNPDELNALLLRAIAAWHLNKRDVALASARQAAVIAPDSYQAQYLYGWMLAQRNDSTKNAIQVLRKALELRPFDRNTQILLGQCCLRINSDDALMYFRGLSEAERSRPEIQTALAIYYLDRRDSRARNMRLVEKALVNAYKYKDAEVKASGNPDVVLNLALYFDHYRHNRTKALDFYRYYLRLTRSNPELNPTRAQVQARISKLRR